MKISVRFTMAIEMLILCKQFEDIEKMTSKTLAEKIGTSPIIARQIMMNLSSAGLIESKIGPGGITLKKPLNEITLLEVYKALGEDEGSLLKFPVITNPFKPDPNADTILSGYSLTTDSGIDIDIDTGHDLVPSEQYCFADSLRTAMKKDFKEIQATFENELSKRTVDAYYKSTLPAFTKFGNFNTKQ